MTNLLHITIVIFSIIAFSNAGINIGAELLQNGHIAEKDIQTLYQTYLHLLTDFSHSDDRYSLFRANVLNIASHNNNTSSTYKKAINQYTGLFSHEIVGTAIMQDQNCKSTLATTLNVAPSLPIGSIPSSFDWRDAGIITAVKDQKLCGSCWAFAATGALEAFWALYSGVSPVELSEQQLIDCSESFGNTGCEGGLPSKAFEYIKTQSGLNTENAYPYEAINDTCRYNRYSNGAKAFSGSVNIAQGNEQAILNSLIGFGPITVAFQVEADFLLYDSGIYRSFTCSSSATAVNHAALIVGYGTDLTNGIAYWIVKNSWGTMWGEDGYFLIERGINMCGIAECASYPNLSGTPKLGAKFDNLFVV